MKKTWIGIFLLLMFAAETAALALFAVGGGGDGLQDLVMVNEAVHTVQSDWGHMESHENRTNLDYVALDADGTVLFRTREGLSESVSEAVRHRDTMLNLQIEGRTVGKMILYNDSEESFRRRRSELIIALSVVMLAQLGVCAGYFFYLNNRIVTPFQKLQEFARRVAEGNLEIPLEMDRGNLFGAFTESFDMMRSELRKARRAEAEANADKKELVAKLSHDIRTPVASIKAAAEVGGALAEGERHKENYIQIIRKTDQIDTLVTNLFTATLKDLRQLPVTPEDMESGDLAELLTNADYLHRAAVPAIPPCVIRADRLRLQQVLDNVFSNSYKYADTKIEVAARRNGSRLEIEIEDHGGGVREEELSLLKGKFQRGSNAEKVEGAGLGLYISDYFLRKMGGELIVENGERGLRVTVICALSGGI